MTAILQMTLWMDVSPGCDPRPYASATATPGPPIQGMKRLRLDFTIADPRDGIDCTTVEPQVSEEVDGGQCWGILQGVRCGGKDGHPGPHGYR